MLLEMYVIVNILPIENVFYRKTLSVLTYVSHPAQFLTPIEREKPVGFLTYELNIESHVSHSKTKQSETGMFLKAVLSG